MNELALFAGAGGGILGGHLLGWRTVCAVEFAAYPRSVLLARQRDGMLPKFPVWDDVRTFDGTAWRGSVDVISGGFPCQDISVAGKGDGLDGERSGLWSEMSRIIGEVQPRFAFVENSPMLTSRGLDRVLGDLSEMGYDAVYGVVSAADAGAPHRRERIWILAYSNVSRLQEHKLFDADLPIGPSNAAPEEVGSVSRQHPINEDVANASGERLEGAEQFRIRNSKFQRTCDEGSQHPIGQLADPDMLGCLHGQAEERTAIGGVHAQREPEPSGEDVANAGRQFIARIAERGTERPEPDTAGAGWWSTEPGLGRVAHGVARRVDRLKAIGNGQVPHVAALAWNTLYERIANRTTSL